MTVETGISESSRDTGVVPRPKWETKHAQTSVVFHRVILRQNGIVLPAFLFQVVKSIYFSVATDSNFLSQFVKLSEELFSDSSEKENIGNC